MALLTQDIYRSSNGDRWRLIRDTASGRKFVRHEANLSSGGQVTDTDLDEFLIINGSGPEHAELRRMVRDEEDSLSLGDNRGDAAGELTVRVMVNGTTVMGIYEVKGATVLLASADFGNASAALDGMAPEMVVAQLLREIGEREMARSGVHYMRDGETNPHDA